MITCVSLTGADDNVAVDDLIDLAERYDAFVPPEWGILYFPEKEGTPRNPSARWRAEFLEVQLPLVAAHLCGEQVFREILAGDKKRIRDLRQYGRLQVNINARQRIFTDDEVRAVYDALLGDGASIIMQHHQDSAALIEAYLDSKLEDLDQCSLLFDSSKGKGVLPDQWREPFIAHAGSVYCGYAGGLGPDTIVNALPRIQAAAADEPFWIDMESGIRTDNEFDLAKAGAVLSRSHGQWSYNILAERL